MKVEAELVQDWMSTRLVTAEPHRSLREVYHLMMTHAVRRILVVTYRPETPDIPYLAGIITLSDLHSFEAAGALSADPIAPQLTVDKFMTQTPKTTRPTDTIGEAAQVMLENKISGLPVVAEQQKLQGIITESDIFRMVVAHEWRRNISNYMA